MHDLLVSVLCVASIAPIYASFLLFDRLLRMESKAPYEHRHRGGRAVGMFGMYRQMTGACPRWQDIKALLLGLQLYLLWLFQMPLWVRNDASARQALWTVRALFWTGFVGMNVVKDTLL